MNNSNTSTVCLRRTYKYPPEAVFEAFSNPRSLEGWLAPSADILTRVEFFDFQVGGTFRILFPLPDGTELALRGEYITIDRPRCLSFTWLWEAPDVHAGVKSLVNFEFIPQDRGTILVLRHSMLSADGMRDRHGENWPVTLARLETWLHNKEMHL